MQSPKFRELFLSLYCKIGLKMEIVTRRYIYIYI